MSALARAADVLFPPVDHVACGPDAAALAAIADPAINLAVWQRSLAPALIMDANRLLAGAAGDLRLHVHVPDVPDALATAVAAAGWPAVPALVADIAELARHAAAAMAAKALDLRLEIVTGDACRKFHADYVTLRLISSYAGPGSQWLSNADAAALAAAVPVEQLDVRCLLAGEVALFKGRLLSDTPIIHRSPPIAGTGSRRLVLVMNPAQGGCC
jgi:hypothetical protein